ncbi:MAG: PEGA domain-containing protein [Polyangiales bacterium]
MKVRSLLFLLAFGSMGVTCYGPGRPDQAPAMLRVRAVPEEARVSIDDRYAATARTLAVEPRALRPGHHQITLEAPGYFPHDLELDLPSGETAIDVRLRPLPP